MARRFRGPLPRRMYLLNDGGPLPYGGSNAFDRARADIADGEYPGYAGLQRQLTTSLLACSRDARGGECARPNESLVVQLDATALSQPVAGSAPVKTNTFRISFSVSFPVELSRHRTRSSCPSRDPDSATSSVRVSTSMFSVASIRSTRYWDMFSARLGPRTSIQIFERTGAGIPRLDLPSCRRRSERPLR